MPPGEKSNHQNSQSVHLYFAILIEEFLSGLAGEWRDQIKQIQNVKDDSPSHQVAGLKRTFIQLEWELMFLHGAISAVPLECALYKSTIVALGRATATIEKAAGLLGQEITSRLMDQVIELLKNDRSLNELAKSAAQFVTDSPLGDGCGPRLASRAPDLDSKRDLVKGIPPGYLDSSAQISVIEKHFDFEIPPKKTNGSAPRSRWLEDFCKRAREDRIACEQPWGLKQRKRGIGVEDLIFEHDFYSYIYKLRAELGTRKEWKDGKGKV